MKNKSHFHNVADVIFDFIVFLFGALLIGFPLYSWFFSSANNPEQSKAAIIVSIVIGFLICIGPLQRWFKPNSKRSEKYLDNQPGRPFLWEIGRSVMLLGHIIIAITFLGLPTMLIFGSPGAISGVPIAFGVVGALFFYLLGSIFKHYGNEQQAN